MNHLLQPVPGSSSSSPSKFGRSESDRPVGPKCGACGEIGHNKNSKICPQYFSAEAVQRREVEAKYDNNLIYASENLVIHAPSYCQCFMAH